MVMLLSRKTYLLEMLCKFLKSASAHVCPSAREFPNFALTANAQIYATQWLHHYATCELRARNQGNTIEKKFGRKSRPSPDVFYIMRLPFLIMTSLVRNLCLLLEGAADIFACCINYNSRECYSAQLQADAEDSFIQTLLHYPPIVAGEFWKM
jgi:hypothetical protein